MPCLLLLGRPAPADQARRSSVSQSLHWIFPFRCWWLTDWPQSVRACVRKSTTRGGEAKFARPNCYDDNVSILWVCCANAKLGGWYVLDNTTEQGRDLSFRFGRIGFCGRTGESIAARIFFKVFLFTFFMVTVRVLVSWLGIASVLLTPHCLRRQTVTPKHEWLWAAILYLRSSSLERGGRLVGTDYKQTEVLGFGSKKIPKISPFYSILLDFLFTFFKVQLSWLLWLWTVVCRYPAMKVARGYVQTLLLVHFTRRFNCSSVVPSERVISRDK